MLTQCVLVTGGNGFVGKALPAGALSKGYAVRVSSHQKLSAPKSRIEYCQVGDLGPATDWSAVLQGVDAVVHCRRWPGACNVGHGSRFAGSISVVCAGLGFAGGGEVVG